MADTRYSREDLAEMVDRLTRAANEEPFDPAHPELATMQRNGLKVAAAMLSEAANRAPTHAELVDWNDAAQRQAENVRRALLGFPPTPKPGTPQQDGPTSQPSAPAEGASEERGVG